MKYQIRHKRLAAAYKKIKRDAYKIYPTEGATPFSRFDALINKLIMEGQLPLLILK